ncbi:MAG: flippase-like domain-containing protein [Nitrospinae bacterium]|nr:flippase-like domain-containing protein [Nitrospinota bacterium]
MANLFKEGKGSFLKKLRIIFIIFGISILGGLIYYTGPRIILNYLKIMGWYTPLILIPYAVLIIFDAKAWAYSFNPSLKNKKVGLGILYLVRMAGESVNNLTPTGYLGGEPVKALLLKRFGVTLTEGLTSVVVAKTTMIIAQIIFMSIGGMILLSRVGCPINIKICLLIAPLISGGGLALIVRWQKMGCFSSIIGFLKRPLAMFRILESVEERLVKIDQSISHFYISNKKGFTASIFFHFIGWVLGTAEVYLMLYLMDVKVSIADSLIIESMGQFIKGLGFFMPGSLGIYEGGGVIIFRILGMEGGTGLTLIVIKRIREIVFNLIGLLLILQLGGKRKRLKK